MKARAVKKLTVSLAGPPEPQLWSTGQWIEDNGLIVERDTIRSFRLRSRAQLFLFPFVRYLFRDRLQLFTCTWVKSHQIKKFDFPIFPATIPKDRLASSHVEKDRLGRVDL